MEKSFYSMCLYTCVLRSHPRRVAGITANASWLWFHLWVATVSCQFIMN